MNSSLVIASFMSIRRPSRRSATARSIARAALAHAFDLERVGACDDVDGGRTGARRDGRADLGHHLAGWNDFLVIHLPALLRRLLVFEEHRRDAHRLHAAHAGNPAFSISRAQSASWAAGSTNGRWRRTSSLHASGPLIFCTDQKCGVGADPAIPAVQVLGSQAGGGALDV